MDDGEYALPRIWDDSDLTWSASASASLAAALVARRGEGCGGGPFAFLFLGDSFVIPLLPNTAPPMESFPFP
jgi:hypothetical protein